MRANRALAGRRIVVVLEDLRLGGAERQALLFADALARDEGARVQVWGLGPAGPAADLCRSRGIDHRAGVLPIPVGGYRHLLTSVPRLARELAEAAPEVILPYTIIPNVLCGLAAAWSGATLCVWNQRDAGVARMGRTIERLAARHIGRFVSNSRPGVRFLTDVIGIEPGRISLIPNGVETGVFPPGAGDGRAERDLSGFHVCMIANIHSNKDHETLLRAWRLALDRWPLPDRPGRLLLAGREGETASGLRDLSTGLGLDESVRFLGAVEDIPGLLNTVDLGVFSSRLEGCPNGVLECMAAGLAVVGTDIEGIRDVVGEEGHDLLAPAGDPESLAERILLAVGNEALRRRLGEAGKVRVADRFSPERMIREMTGVIARGLGSGGDLIAGGRDAAGGQIDATID